MCPTPTPSVERRTLSAASNLRVAATLDTAGIAARYRPPNASCRPDLPAVPRGILTPPPVTPDWPSHRNPSTVHVLAHAHLNPPRPPHPPPTAQPRVPEYQSVPFHARTPSPAMNVETGQA
ncbi:hypothetical protein B0H17DRAFT_1072255 [Mycena rosella]|uniref:Uncharacterized protein n=1 Tax=Mycena rosella TaxID=1033263 RepID=A0AAD7D9M6_MYCRO|nr:hypothetical protein B0H17DRAFT_1072255 [Mycena rosella]